MRVFTATLIGVVFSVIVTYPGRQAVAQERVYDAAIRLENQGKFKEATALLERTAYETSKKVSPLEKEKLLFQIERMRRIRIDYSLTADELYSQLVAGIKGVTPEEFDRWVREGKFDARTIDDTLRFVSPSRSNLFFRYSEIAARKIPPVDESGKDHAILNSCVSIERAVDSLDTPYVLPANFRMRMEARVDSGTVRPGEIIKAWLPIPRNYPYQKDFELLSSSSRPLDVASPESPIRSVFMEQPADSDGGATFEIKYTYQRSGVRFKLDPRVVKPYDTSNSTYKKYTRGGPNIIFTNKIRKLSREVVGNETNPLLKARKIYDWVSRNIKYSFAREYSTINNIGGYCLTKEYGDCGQEAMLFITLCRFNGIPARWQSGWFFFPGGKDIHDWTEIYIPPYGWVPVDPYMGILATRYMTDLTNAERDTVRDFYFGGLEHFRMSANSDNNQKLTPAKKYFRSDNVDFQRAELETNEENIYFNRFNYSLHIEEGPSK